ncbi:MAG TPA: DUF952 domain-containing protein [Mycobacteriales bacterium]|nr:DUF952 domain-containing protein [Mycobacteriales bacterium]
MRIFHVSRPEDWAEQKRGGALIESTLDQSLAEVGYIHCSFLDQVEGVAARHYGAIEGDLVLLEIEGDALGDLLKVEPAGHHGDYPHVYGPVPVTAVVAEHRFTRDQGVWRLPAHLSAS